jgi:AcrR family transcriptional regulator
VTESSLRKRQQQTRRAILDAALQLVAENGIDRVSWRSIARAVHYSPSGMYEYFNGKDDIIQTLAEEGLAELDEYLAMVDSSMPLEEQFVDSGLAYIRFARDHPVRFDIAFSLLPSKRESLDQAPTGAYKRLYDLVQLGLDATTLRTESEDDADALAYLFWSLFHGMASLQTTHLSSLDVVFEDTDRAGIRALFRGLFG